MTKIVKKFKSKKTLSNIEQANPLLTNMDGAGILSEIHPIAAGVYNTTYFVIMPSKQKTNQDLTSQNAAKKSRHNVEDEGQENLPSSPGQPSRLKPKHTYRELIAKALMDKHELTLSDIYTWICTFYPFYSVTDDKWKNSIRHNLSLYPEFLKGSKTEQSAGHLWYLDTNFRVKHQEEEKDKFNADLGNIENKKVGHREEKVSDGIDPQKNNPWFYQDHSRFSSNSTSIELQKSAAEILSGIKRPTTVEENVCLPFAGSQEDVYTCIPTAGSFHIQMGKEKHN